MLGMKKKMIIIIPIVLVILVIVSVIGIYVIKLDKSDINTVNEYTDAGVERVGRFTAKTASKLLTKGENTCYSPMYLYSELSVMTKEIDGDARTEVIEALGLGNEGQTLFYKNYQNVWSRVLLKTYDEGEIIEFHDEWAREFDKLEIGKFILADGSKVEAEYMSDEDYMQFVRGKDYLAVGKYYHGYYDLVVVLPNADIELDSLLREDKLNEILASYTSSDGADVGMVTLTIPKFEISDEISEDSIKSCLNSIGIEKVLDEEELYLKQSLKIIVDEEKSEEYAKRMLGGVHMCDDVPEYEDVTMTVDRPFLYIILKDDIPVYIGTVYNPVE